MKKSLFYFFLCAFAATTWTACDDDDPLVEENEEELITTVNMSLVSPSGGATFTFRDLDGPGGDDPVVTGGTLSANTTYAFSTTFLNESESPVEDITEEVREEGDEHFVLYSDSGLGFTFMRTDSDNDGNPIGLIGSLTTGDAGTGSLLVELRHEPTKTATGATGGETDVAVSFQVVVE